MAQQAFQLSSMGWEEKTTDHSRAAIVHSRITQDRSRAAIVHSRIMQDPSKRVTVRSRAIITVQIKAADPEDSRAPDVVEEADKKLKKLLTFSQQCV